MSDDEYKPHSMNATLARIEVKLDEALRAKADHEARISSLEKWRHYVLGAFALAGAAAGVGAKSIVAWFSNKQS